MAPKVLEALLGTRFQGRDFLKTPLVCLLTTSMESCPSSDIATTQVAVLSGSHLCLCRFAAADARWLLILMDRCSTFALDSAVSWKVHAHLFQASGLKLWNGGVLDAYDEA